MFSKTNVIWLLEDAMNCVFLEAWSTLYQLLWDHSSCSFEFYAK